MSQLFNCQDFKASKLFELYPLDHNDRYNSVHGVNTDNNSCGNITFT